VSCTKRISTMAQIWHGHAPMRVQQSRLRIDEAATTTAMTNTMPQAAIRMRMIMVVPSSSVHSSL